MSGLIVEEKCKPLISRDKVHIFSVRRYTRLQLRKVKIKNCTIQYNTVPVSPKIRKIYMTLTINTAIYVKEETAKVR